MQVQKEVLPLFRLYLLGVNSIPAFLAQQACGWMGEVQSIIGYMPRLFAHSVRSCAGCIAAPALGICSLFVLDLPTDYMHNAPALLIEGRQPVTSD